MIFYSEGQKSEEAKKEEKTEKILPIRDKVLILQSSCKERDTSLRYGVMVALQILALSVRVRILLSQQTSGSGRFVFMALANRNGGVAQLVSAADS